MRRSLLLAGLLTFLASLAYLPAMRGGFIWDDVTFVTENRLIHAPDGLRRFWFTTEATDYWPVTYSAFWVQWRLWGMNPVGYHLTNLALHITSALLLAAVLRRARVPGAWLAALVFALHPVNVESVAWIFQLKNLLALVFMLAATLAWMKTDPRSWGLADDPQGGNPSAETAFVTERDDTRRGAWAWHAVASVACALALLSKISAAVLPVLLMGLAWWRHGRLRRRDLIALAPLFIITLALGVLNLSVQTHRSLGGEAIITGGWPTRLAGAGAAIGFYLYKAVMPFNLAFIYPRWQVEPSSILWWAPLVALLLALGVTWLRRRAWGSGTFFALAFFVVALLPAVGLMDVYYLRYSLVADHYQHIALMAVAALAGVGAARLLALRSVTGRRLSMAGCVIVVAALAGLTWRQAGVYRSEETIWRDTVKKNPTAWLAWNNLGNLLLDRGDADEAEVMARRAVQSGGRFAETHASLGRAMVAQGRVEEGIESYHRALEIDPRYAEVHFNAGNAWLRLGRIDLAVGAFGRAVSIYPAYVPAHINLAVACLRLNDPVGAEAALRRALAIEPDNANALNRLGIVLLGRGELPEAARQFARIVAINPTDQVARARWSQIQSAIDEARIAGVGTEASTKRDADAAGGIRVTAATRNQ